LEDASAAIDVVLEYKARWQDQCAAHDRAGAARPAAPVPHPDEVVVDTRTGTIIAPGFEIDKWRADQKAP
jgi:hypothetical protein